MTRVEFANKIRLKFPGKYDDLEDDVLVSKTLATYPEYKDDVEPTAIERYRANRSGLSKFITGAGKGVISTIEGMSSLGEKGLQAVTRPITGVREDGKIIGKKTAAEKMIPEELRTPEGKAEKAGFMTEQIAEFFVPVTKATKVKKGAALGTKIIKKGGNILKEGLEIGAKSALQSGGDIKETATGTVAGLAGGTAGEFILAPIFKSIFPKLSKVLEKVNLRLTPAQKRKAEKGIEGALEVIEENKLVGTPEKRVEKIRDIYTKTEDDIQNFLTKEAADVTTPKSSMIEKLEGLKSKYVNERDVLSIEKQIDEAVELLTTRYPDEIPLVNLNKLKRSTYKNAYNQAGDKVLDFVEHDIGDVLNQGLIEGAGDLTINGKLFAEFNSKYGKIINARKLLEVAASRKQVGLIGKLMAIGMGSSIGSAGGPVGSAIGFGASAVIAEQLAGTLTRSLTAEMLRKLSRMPAAEATKALTRLIVPLINKGQEETNE